MEFDLLWETKLQPSEDRFWHELYFYYEKLQQKLNNGDNGNIKDQMENLQNGRIY